MSVADLEEGPGGRKRRQGKQNKAASSNPPPNPLSWRSGSGYMISSYRFKVLQFISQMLNSSFNVNQGFVSSVLTVLWIGTSANKSVI